jgi:hypothetical protein
MTKVSSPSEFSIFNFAPKSPSRTMMAETGAAATSGNEAAAVDVPIDDDQHQASSGGADEEDEEEASAGARGLHPQSHAAKGVHPSWRLPGVET